MSDSLWLHEPQHARPPCPPLTPRVYSNSCPLSRWCHLSISSSVIPFSSCPQSFPASGSFQTSQLFTSGGQSTGVSALASVLPMNTQDWSPLGWTGWISLQSKGLSRVFSNTTVQKHQLWTPKSFFAFKWEAPGEKHKQMTWTVLPQGFGDSPHLFGQAFSQDLLDLDLGPNGKIFQYVDDLLICSPDEKSAQRHAIQVLNFLAERGYKVSCAKAQMVERKVTYLGV